MILTKHDQHVNEMMTTACKFKNFSWSRFLIIMQNINMVTNGKYNCRMIPSVTVTATGPGRQVMPWPRTIDDRDQPTAQG